MFPPKGTLLVYPIWGKLNWTWAFIFYLWIKKANKYLVLAVLAGGGSEQQLLEHTEKLKKELKIFF
jgi:hypothetical protein